MMQRRVLSRAASARLAVCGARPAAAAAGHLPLIHAAQQPARIGVLSSALQSRLLGAVPRFYSSAASASAAAESAAEEGGNSSGRVTRFDELESVGVHRDLVDAIVKGMGYDTMTEVQSLTLEPALAGKDVVAQAKTGTGKTLAFVLPLMQKILSSPRESAYKRGATDIRAIIISPTRELAEQIAQEAREIGKHTRIAVQAAVGGTQRNLMLRQARSQGCDVLVATPGRLLDLLSDPNSGIAAPNIEALVLDEADRMLEVGFSQALSDILECLPSPAKQPRQTLLYSATLPKDVVKLARSYINPRNFQFCQTIQENDVATHHKVPQFVVPCNGFENIVPAAVEMLYREADRASLDSTAPPLKAMIFLPTTSMVEMVYETLNSIQRRYRRLPLVLHIHSKLTQSQRTQVAKRFKAAESAILVSSDVTARGMHFPNVSHVIQLFSPPNEEQYIHRVGRTGRADKGGQAWLFVPAPLVRATTKQLLADLPLQQVNDLESASFDATAAPLSDDTQPPKAYQDVTMASKMAPEYVLSDAYTSIFNSPSFHGPRFGSREVGEAMNQWCTTGWGMERPPAVSRFWARKAGVESLPSMNIMSRGSEDNVKGRRDLSGKGEFLNRPYDERRGPRRPAARRPGRRDDTPRSYNRGGFGGNQSNRSMFRQKSFDDFE